MRPQLRLVDPAEDPPDVDPADRLLSLEPGIVYRVTTVSPVDAPMTRTALCERVHHSESRAIGEETILTLATFNEMDDDAPSGRRFEVYPWQLVDVEVV